MLPTDNVFEQRVAEVLGPLSEREGLIIGGQISSWMDNGMLAVALAVDDPASAVGDVLAAAHQAAALLVAVRPASTR